MLRSAKQISFKDIDINSNKGVIMSPIINICGLILRADNPVPEKIKEFLQNHGAIVNRVKYKSEMHVRIIGSFNFTKQSIENFIENNQQLVSEQYEGLSEIPEAIQLQQEISKYLDDVEQGVPLSAKYMGQQLSLNSSVTYAGTGINFASAVIENSGRFCTKGNYEAKSSQHLHSGTKSQAMLFGFFAEVRCKLESSQIGNMKFENAIVDSGQEMSFSSASENDTVSLEIDHNYTWGNNPHPEVAKKLAELEEVKSYQEFSGKSFKLA